MVLNLEYHAVCVFMVVMYFCNLDDVILDSLNMLSLLSQSHQFSDHHLNLVTMMLLLIPLLTPLLLYLWLMWRWWVDYRIWKVTS